MSHIETVILRCHPDEETVQAVERGGSRTALGQPAQCRSESDRLQLALWHGFVTQAERDYAQLLSIERAGTATDPTWLVEFDMAEYLAALARL